MTERAEQLLSEVLALPDDQRQDFLNRLIEATGGGTRGFATPQIAAAWDAEIARRIEEIDSGKVQLVPWKVVRRRMRAVGAKINEP